MIPEARGQTGREAAKLGGMLFLAVAVAFAAISVVWAHELRSPRVTLLGSGANALSVLVTTGGARLLIATGDQPIAFGNALERARHPIARRLDIVLIAGQGRDLLAPEAIAADPGVGYLATIGRLSPSPEATALAAGGINALTTSKRIQLDDHTTVDLDLETTAEGGETVWRATIRRQATAVVVLSSAVAASSFEWPGPVSALVIAAGDEPESAWDATPAPVLAFPNEATSDAGPREFFAARDGPVWAVRVAPGEAVRLGFGSNGLELAPAAAVPLGSSVSARRRWPTSAGHGRTRPGS
ncbi:MAG: hypothetical protein M3464_16640 [Chloroflexota bacterium]|nr:hypothetical protein [Chloroflexota bacterium]